jgi:DNA-binding NtrC family response regulator
MSTRSAPISDPAAQVSASNAPERRQNLVRILFVNRCLGDVERCLQELKRLRFTVSSDVVLTPEQFVERLRVDVYDTIVAEHPSPNWHETQALDILQHMGKDIPLIFLAHGLKRETAAEFILKGAADCIELDSIGHLPVAVHRALEEKNAAQSTRASRKRAAAVRGALSRPGGKSELRDLLLQPRRKISGSE